MTNLVMAPYGPKWSLRRVDGGSDLSPGPRTILHRAETTRRDGELQMYGSDLSELSDQPAYRHEGGHVHRRADNKDGRERYVLDRPANGLLGDDAGEAATRASESGHRTHHVLGKDFCWQRHVGPCGMRKHRDTDHRHGDRRVRHANQQQQTERHEAGSDEHGRFPRLVERPAGPHQQSRYGASRDVAQRESHEWNPAILADGRQVESTFLLEKFRSPEDEKIGNWIGQDPGHDAPPNCPGRKQPRDRDGLRFGSHGIAVVLDERKFSRVQSRVKPRQAKYKSPDRHPHQAQRTADDKGVPPA